MFFFFNGLDSKRNLSGSILLDSKFEPNSENTLMVVVYKYTNTNYLYNDYKFSFAFHQLNNIHGFFFFYSFYVDVFKLCFYDFLVQRTFFTAEEKGNLLLLLGFSV